MTQLITYEAEGAVGTQVVPILPPEEFARIKICLNCPLPDCCPESPDCPLRQLPPVGRQVRDSGVYCPRCGATMRHSGTAFTQKYGKSHTYRCRDCYRNITIHEAELSQKAREALRWGLKTCQTLSTRLEPLKSGNEAILRNIVKEK